MSRYSTLVIADGAIDYWRLGETGATAADSVGSNPGTYTNAPAQGVTGLLTDDGDGAVTLTRASSQSISVPHNASLNQGAGALTWECWFQAADANSANTWTFMDKGAGAPIFDINNAVNGELAFRASGQVGAKSSQLVIDTARHHYVGTKDASNNFKIYVDGRDVTTVVGTTATIDNTNALTLGGLTSTGSYANGTLDEVAIYNVALTAAQVYTHFVVGSNAAYSYRPVEIANRNVGPRALRRTFRKHRTVWWGEQQAPGGPVANLLTLTAALSFSGAIAKQTARTLTAALSFTGAIQKQAGKALTGALSFTGAQIKSTGKALTAGLSFSGFLVKRTSRTLTGALSFTGSITRATSRTLASALSFTGNLAPSHLARVTLTAVLSFTGAFSKRTNKALTAGLSFIGNLVRAASRTFAGALSFTGSIAKRTARTLTGGLSFAGVFTAVKSGTLYQQTLTAALSFTGSMTKGVRKTSTAALSFTGNLTSGHIFSRTLTATLSFTGSLRKQTGRALAAALSFTGAIAKRTAKSLTGALSFAGVLAAARSAVIGGLPPQISAIAGSFIRGIASAMRPSGSADHDKPGGNAGSPRPGR